MRKRLLGLRNKIVAAERMGPQVRDPFRFPGMNVRKWLTVAPFATFSILQPKCLDLSSGIEYLTGSAEKLEGKAVLGRYRASAHTQLRSLKRRRTHAPWLSAVEPRRLDPRHGWPGAGLPAGAGTDGLPHAE